jgi:26S proteasome regulatory subunit N7
LQQKELGHADRDIKQKNAETQYRVTEEKTVGAGQKMDIVFTVIRLGFFWNDNGLISRNLEKAKG